MTSDSLTGPPPVLGVDSLGLEVAIGGVWTPVLDDVSFEIARAETLALVGGSGSGKTLTGLAILGLLPKNVVRVATGRILVNGSDVVRLPERALRKVRGRDVAMVFQDPMSSLNPAFTVGEQVAEPLRLHTRTSRAGARRRAVELLGEVGIPDAARRASAFPHEFSGGMRQRVMIAMALACEPLLLVADEPTTALDVTTQAQIVELLDGLARARSMSILFISHDLGVVSEVADRVMVMYAGQLVELGSTDQILRAPAHPYTEGLLKSVRDVLGSPDRLHLIPGHPPAPGTVTSGCRFRSRCDHRISACETDVPLGLTAGRPVRCVRAEELLGSRPVPNRAWATGE